MGLTLVPVGLLLIVVAVKERDPIALAFGLAIAALGYLMWRIGKKHGWWDPWSRP